LFQYWPDRVGKEVLDKKKKNTGTISAEEVVDPKNIVSIGWRSLEDVRRSEKEIPEMNL